MDWRSGVALAVLMTATSLLVRGRLLMARRLRTATSLVEDLRQRQRRALEINDEIVQGLATAKLSLELDRPALTAEALDSTLGSARGAVTELLGEMGRRVAAPGDLRRSRGALLEKS